MKKLLPVALIMVIFLAPGLRAEKGEGSVVLMLNKSDDTVAFVDPDSLEILGTAPTGVGPHEVAVERTGRYAYVANYGRQSPGGSLSVIDVRARKEVEKIDLGSNCRPHGLAFSPSDQGNSPKTLKASALLLVRVVLSSNRSSSRIAGSVTEWVWQV